jgi:hypothetical protein
LIQKSKKKFSAVIFFFNFFVIKPWIRIGIQPKMLDLDPDPDEMNADPQPWFDTDPDPWIHNPE